MRPKRTKVLIPRKVFIRKMFFNLLYTFLLLVFSLAIGTIGYHHFLQISWMDAFYNTSMILTGMGPVDHVETDGGKIFASIFAVYSGVAFLSSVAVFLGPLVHRMLHKYHLDVVDED